MAEGEASKAGVLDEDLEDVFHNCTRCLLSLVDPSILLLAVTRTVRRGTSTWCATWRASSASAGRRPSGTKSERQILDRGNFQKQNIFAKDPKRIT